MRDRGHGRIVNLASIAGQRGASVNGVHYAASKAGIVAITRFAASELAPYGVTVNAIAPAASTGRASPPSAADKIEAMVQTIPVRPPRPARGDRRAGRVPGSDEAGFVTGATYDINGGMLMR
jgi:3-oxoacyl-[acyl-carrier protein] reductase